MYDVSLFPVIDIISVVMQIEKLALGMMVLIVLAAAVRFTLWAALSFLIPVPRLGGLVADVITFSMCLLLYASGRGPAAVMWGFRVAQTLFPSLVGRLTSLTGLLGPGGF
ncbi:hypothetical protein [Neomoorella mulderi]|uniref:Spore cortex protein YabQ n=1 Tax=Moorella mulderi DSM 14980 TaxID=1122241 RepID=A0A151ASN9_9FIRM|nr:hypothetical protein [Moorella mulderi]KYH30659.1 hypothetical protein MOMUL_29920 [Moorella mulderi DSM 14980]